MSEIVWYWQRQPDGPETIITDTAFGSLLWIMVFGGLMFSEWVFDFPQDDRVPLGFLAVGFALGPWYLFIRWVKWRY